MWLALEKLRTQNLNFTVVEDSDCEFECLHNHSIRYDLMLATGILDGMFCLVQKNFSGFELLRKVLGC